MLAPSGRSGAWWMALVLSAFVHGGLLYLAANTRPGQRVALMLAPVLPGQPEQHTIPLTFAYVEQPETAPPEHPVRSTHVSDRDRVARGGEVRPDDPKGHVPRLRGTSPEMVFDPGRKEPRAAPEPQRSAPPAPPAAAASEPTGADPRTTARGAERAEPQRDAAAMKLGAIASAPATRPTYRSLGEGGLFGAGSGAVSSTGAGGSGTEGSVSFETSWFDWGEYASAMLRKIKWNWTAPHALYVGVKGHVRVSFVVLRTGTITDVTMESGSGTSSYDQAAIAAIERSSPLAPLPADFPFDREKVTINFLYNMSRLASKQDPAAPPTPGS